MRRGPLPPSRQVRGPTVRVHGAHLFMHVCDGHQAEAQRIVGEPNVVTKLTGPWVTSDDMER